ncbi:MAG: hypothetical protein P1P81_05150 [Desulfobulbales bacterium]|nr:hypothetical protein [Desulfobulbales bacterium]
MATQQVGPGRGAFCSSGIPYQKTTTLEQQFFTLFQGEERGKRAVDDYY